MFRVARFVSAKRAFSTGFGEIVALKGSSESLNTRLPLSKIVATIGPASENLPTLSHVVDAGLRVMRINFSHATYEEADLRVGNLNKCFGINHPDGKLVNGFANMRGVMLDTQGPEIRTGSFGNGQKEVELEIDQVVTLTNDPSVRNNQTADKIWVSYEKLQSTVSLGARILLDDGAVEVVAEGKGANNGEVICRVKNQGTLGNKKGVNLPGLVVELPAMCEKDKVDIRWGIQNNVDYIAASFVRKASDVTEIRDYTAALRKEMFPNETGKGAAYEHLPLVISKIESVEALVNFDAILAESDAIMVARGDLAVEIPMETLANVQKEIVRRCNAAGKPVIVATQMLETMQKNPRPTRAECTDVANAIFDGADCVMLSGESAKGKYPVQAVSMMNRIVTQSELAQAETEPLVQRPVPALESTVDGMAFAAVQAATAQRGNASLAAIVVLPTEDIHTGTALARRISAHRPHLPVLTLVPNHKEGRRLQLHKCLHPILSSETDPTKALAHLQKLGLLKAGQQAVVVRERSAGSGDVAVELVSA